VRQTKCYPSIVSYFENRQA